MFLYDKSRLSHSPSSSSSHVPGSSNSISKPELCISSSGHVLSKHTTIVDWLARARSSQEEDSDAIALSQVSVDSYSSTVTRHTNRSLSLPSSLSLLSPPSGIPPFILRASAVPGATDK